MNTEELLDKILVLFHDLHGENEQGKTEKIYQELRNALDALRPVAHKPESHKKYAVTITIRKKPVNTARLADLLKILLSKESEYFCDGGYFVVSDLLVEDDDKSYFVGFVVTTNSEDAYKTVFPYGAYEALKNYLYAVSALVIGNYEYYQIEIVDGYEKEDEDGEAE